MKAKPISDYKFIKKEEFNHYSEVHLFFYTYIDSELHLLLHRQTKEKDETFQEFYEVLQKQDNTPPFAIARIMATKYRGLFKKSNIEKISKGEIITEKDINESSEYIWYKIWNDDVFQEYLNILSTNPIQYDNIKGKLIYFLELPEINVNLFNQNLEKLNYEYNFIYQKYSFEELNENDSKLFRFFDFNTHIQNTIKLIQEDLLDYYVIVSCKPAGNNKDQAGIFHFPALFNGIYRKNNEKWIYLVSSSDPLPDENILKKCKAVIIPGSHLHVYDNYDFLRKTEEWIREIIHNWPQIKYLGICFGFQLISDALGGKTESMGGVFIRGTENIHVEDNFWNFDFVKNSGLNYTKTFSIQQAHSDHVPRLPDYEKYKLKNYAFSESCGTELVVSDDGRILCFQGHPEYDPYFNTYRMAAISSVRMGLELNPENLLKIRDQMLSNPKSDYVNTLELRTICNSFLKN